MRPSVALRIRMVRVMPVQAVDIGQVGVLAPLLDVAGDAEVGLPVAFIEHVERKPGSWRMCSSRLRPTSMLTRTRTSSH
jgi:hypothetical protein